jgi:hypothetical protein
VEEADESPDATSKSLRPVCVFLFEPNIYSQTIFYSPYLLPNAEPVDFHIGEHIVAASSKIIAIDKILADILPKGERALIFSVSNSSSCCHVRA